jgi:hypothetical protein
MSKKKIITVSLSDISPYELEGTLADVKNQIQSWIEQYGPTARLNWNPDHWPQYNDSPAPQYDIRHDREETDEEYKKRIEQEAIQKSLQDERDRKEFERLSKKLGVK